ncbi:ABC transporter ATP-binding protein [Ottowia thiooxydans]|uniref:Lipopolysaccharide transport system ATP-binding protein n=1 Tax=Ottowia thiooxydans TaxID=219182 RepID=A0ABV2QG13_9BURK
MSATPAVVHADPTPLRLSNLGKEYLIYDSPRARFKSLITGRATHRSHWALRDVSFELQRGQCLGVVGANGAGKSTLLKLITGTLQPSQGQVVRTGRITAILELGAGFHPDFTGRQNLYFGGSLIGITHAEMARVESEILAFAEIGEAIDRPVKTYSSGMVVRLAFALVTAVEPDVLIIDEALAVGDQHFQKKCIRRIEEFRRNGCTILFCSHSPYHIRQLCDVALWLDGGRVMQFGETEPVLGAYEMHTRLLSSSSEDSAEESPGKHEQVQPASETLETTADNATNTTAGSPAARRTPSPDTPATIISVDIADLGEGDPPLLDSRDLVATITVRGHGQERPNIGFMIEQSRGVGITSLATHEEDAKPVEIEPGIWRSVLTFPKLPLHSGEYVISAFLFDESGLVVYDQWFQFMHFRFVMPTLMPGLVKLPHHWA